MKTNFKRTSREMPQEVRNKISAALRGRSLSTDHKNKISAGQKAAWAKLPKSNDANTTSRSTENKNITFAELWPSNEK